MKNFMNENISKWNCFGYSFIHQIRAIIIVNSRYDTNELDFIILNTVMIISGTDYNVMYISYKFQNKTFNFEKLHQHLKLTIV